MAELPDTGNAAGLRHRGGLISKEVKLQDLWRVLFLRRAVFFTCLFVIVAMIMIVTLLSLPIYRATASLQIEPQGLNILTFEDIFRPDNSWVGRHDFMPTQHEILQSQAVLSIASEQLDLVNHPGFVQRKAPPARRMLAWFSSFFSESSPTEGRASLDSSILFIENGLKLDPVQDSQVTYLSFTDQNPQLAADIVNAVADAYIQFQLDSRYNTTGKAKEFLTKDVARLQSEIAQLQRSLQEYGAENEIVGMGDGTSDIGEQALADINRHYTGAKSRMALAEARYRSLLEAPPAGMSEVLNSSSISRLRERASELERQHAQMSERFNRSWPPLIRLEEELETIRLQLDREERLISEQVCEVARAEYEQVKTEVQNLERQIESEKRTVRRIHAGAIEYAAIKSAIESKRTVLDSLLARQSQTETSYRLRETRTSNIRIVDRAKVPEAPIRPRKFLNLLIGLLLGASVGAGTAFLIDHLDNTVKSEQDIKRTVDRVVLGRIPIPGAIRVVESDTESPVRSVMQIDTASRDEAKSEFSEAYRHLRTSLLLATPDHPPRHVVITSPGPGDGKSTVALNLAIVLTQLGRRILLVDADLRRPRLHKALGLSSREGLSSYLSGNATLEGLVQETEIPGLSVVTSGPIPPNPSELLGSPKLVALMHRFLQDGRFDHVIFDTTPALSVTDAVVLASHVDSTILVVRARVTTHDALAQSVAMLQRSHANLSGIVLNAVPQADGYYYSRYRPYADHHRYAQDTEPTDKETAHGSEKSTVSKHHYTNTG